MQMTGGHPDIFLSYNREDLAVARRYAEALQREGFSVWWDQTLNAGETFDEVTAQALKEAKAVLVLWSKHSVESRWVRSEATMADRYGTLVPVMIEPCERPIQFELMHTADMSRWKGSIEDPSWQSLITGLRRQRGRPADEAPVAGASAANIPDAGKVPGRKRAAIAIAAAALVALAGIAWVLARRSTPAAATVAGQVQPGQSSGPVTIAVLPFANLSSDPEQEYFSDGLTEELLNELAQNRSLAVTGRTSSFAFKGRNDDLREIGRQLNVAHLLEGSVRKQGGQVRITAQLIDAGTGVHQWSKTYGGSLNDSFALQEQVARDVAQALSVTLDVGPIRRAQGGTRNSEAYDLYLRASQLFPRDSREDMMRAGELLQQAVALDPEFVLAWASRAGVAGGELERDPDDPERIRRELETARRRVLELAPDSTMAREIRAEALIADGKWAEAEQMLPSGSEPEANQVSPFLVNVGRVRDALAFAERSGRADPLSLAASTNLQLLLDLAGQPERAQAEYLRSKSLEGDHGRADHYSLMRALNNREKDIAAAEAQFDEFLKSEPLPMAISRPLRASLRNPEGARALIRAALDDPSNRHPTRQLILTVYADRFDDRETAIRAMQNASAFARGQPFNYLPWYPFRTAIRADPRFKEMMREHGLVDYWQQTGKWSDFCRPVGEDDFECR